MKIFKFILTKIRDIKEIVVLAYTMFKMAYRLYKEFQQSQSDEK